VNCAFLTIVKLELQEGFLGVGKEIEDVKVL
jgi:hypothetical protein